jgi:hypothetical protein
MLRGRDQPPPPLTCIETEQEAAAEDPAVVLVLVYGLAGVRVALRLGHRGHGVDAHVQDRPLAPVRGRLWQGLLVWHALHAHLKW